ncbi:hypothetical protein SAMN05445871_4270 [Paraburkholderia caballeronis]|nr:hypothetical protein SAMN05445871_4270 [Paraburkholderia caballeronis]
MIQRRLPHCVLSERFATDVASPARIRTRIVGRAADGRARVADMDRPNGAVLCREHYFAHASGRFCQIQRTPVCRRCRLQARTVESNEPAQPRHPPRRCAIRPANSRASSAAASLAP